VASLEAFIYLESCLERDEAADNLPPPFYAVDLRTEADVEDRGEIFKNSE